MNRQELLTKIRYLVDSNEIPQTAIYEESILELPQYRYLYDEYKKNRINKEEWHQVVRFALADPDEYTYMYNRLIQLLLIHRQNHNEYFELKSENASIPMPDRISYLNRLSLLHKEYFEIHKAIQKNIHHEQTSQMISVSSFKGRVNWQETFKRYPHGFPITFKSNIPNKIFETPENIMLILCALILKKESHRLLMTDYIEPLNKKEVSMLNTIIFTIQSIEKFFSFIHVINAAQKFVRLNFDDKRIYELEWLIKLRIKDNKVKNVFNYLRLLKWIQKFRELNIRMVTKRSANFPLDTIRNLDVIYEAWIFFEIISYVSSNYKLLNLKMSIDERYFEFDYKGNVITFFYEKEFKLRDKYAWAITSNPDFTVMQNDEIIAVFDAKNYGADSRRRGEATRIMLAYMTNLDTNFGGLFFPKFKYNEFIHPREGYESKYHHNLKLIHYDLEPKNTAAAIKTTSDRIKQIIKEICERIIAK